MKIGFCGKLISRSSSLFFCIAALLAVVIHSLFIPGVTMDPETDHHVFVLAGKVLCSGGRMYVDYFDHKGPIQFFLNALGWWMCPGYMGVFLIEMFVFLLAQFILWKGLLRRCGAPTAFAVIALLPFLKTDPNFYNHPESWSLEFAMLAIGALLMRRSVCSAIMAGLCAACVFMTKQTLIGSFLAIFIYLLIDACDRKKYVILISYVGAGIFGVLLICLYLVLAGVWPSFVNDCYGFNLLYQNSNTAFVDGCSFRNFIGSVIRTLIDCGVYLVIPCIGVLVWAFKDKNAGREWRTLLLGWATWFAWDVLLIARCGRFFPYHFLTLWFCLIIAVAPTVVFFSCRRPFLLSVILLLPLSHTGCVKLIPRMIMSLKGSYVMRPETKLVNEFIEVQKSYPAMPLFVWGNNANAYLLSGRKNPFPYYYWGPMSVDGFLSDEQIEQCLEVLKNNDVMVVDGMNPSSPQDTEIFFPNRHSKDSTFKKRLRDVVKMYYQLSYEGRLGVKIYTRKRNP